ncbi:MAG: DUF3990 domain-containing protein [Erysipelotrichaceae bacterium]|nr:DUF3990 domain-containing protein [Erysipelotrichaceae bacterium]
MENLITLYHGSEKTVEHPLYKYGKLHNDFGLGFYCTQSEELAKEWAVTSFKDGFCNRYILDTEYLKILNLNSNNYSVLNWIAILLEHRVFSVKNPVANRAKRYLLDHFGINVNAYDVIIGYRADDSYFDYAEAFINNSITLEQLAQALKLGKLGEQVVIKSEFAFSQLSFEGVTQVKSSEYYGRRKDRHDTAYIDYMNLLEKNDDGLYIQDIIRGGITNDDPRIPRNVP